MYQPLPVTLQTFQIQELDRHGLGLQAWPELVVNEALVDRAKPALAEEVTGGEVLGDDRKLG